MKNIFALNARGHFKNRFLHYGFYTFLVAIGVVTLTMHSVLHAHSHSNEKTVTSVENCQKVVSISTIVVTDSGFTPKTVKLPRCSTVIFVNGDQKLHQPAFGEHEHHDTSLPFEEKTLSQGKTSSVTISKAGTYKIHDHYREESTGSVIITP